MSPPSLVHGDIGKQEPFLIRERFDSESSSPTAASVVDVAVALDDELARGGVGVDELGQQWDPHGDRHADRELLPGDSVGA